MKVSYKQPQGQYNVLVKKEYDSWSSSHYSPTGLFKYEFPMSEFLLPTEGRTLHATQSDLVLTIDCEMKNNKFINLEITEHMSNNNLEITIQDIYENIRTASTMVFDYDLTRILPVPMWDKDNIDNYIDNNFNEEYTNEVVELRDAFIIKGYDAVDALSRAVKYVVKDRDLDTAGEAERPALAAASSEQTAKKKASVAKKLKAAEAQPPELEGEGSSSRGENVVDFGGMSEDEFDALPEATLRRLRGDIV